MSKLQYKPTQMQDECWGSSKEKHGITVLVRYEAQGKTKKYYKTDAISFPNEYYLAEYVKENKIDILSEEEFKATPTAKALSLIKATS